MNCPKCKAPMTNLGNLSGVWFTSKPPQWDEVWVCDPCKVKTVLRVHGTLTPVPSRNLQEYESV